MPHALAEPLPARRLSGRVSAVAAPVAVAALGTALLVAADALPYFGSSSIDHSPNQLSWGAIHLFALQFVAAAGTALVAFPASRRIGAGVLVGAGVAGLLLQLQELGFSVTSVAGGPIPHSGELIGVLAPPIVIAGGLLAWPGARRAPERARALLLGQAVAALGALALVIGALVPWAKTPDGSYALLYQPSVGLPAADVLALKWYALAPVGLALVVAGIALGLRSLDHRSAAGALLAIGPLVALSFVSLSFVVGAGVQTRPGGYVGFAGGLLVAAAGAAVLALGRLERASAAAQGQAREDRMSEPGILAHTTATRYLCAAAHLDARFAREVIRRVADEEHRAVAPSFGIDLGTALRHCFAARNRQRVRDVLLATLAVPAILLIVYRHTAAGIGYLALFLGLAWVIVFAESWVSRYQIAARTLSRRSYDPRAAPRVSEAVAVKIAELEAAERSNVTIYSGYRPFVGSGWDQGGWSFALNVSKGKKAFGNGERLTPQPFDAAELYDAVARDVAALEIDGLVVEDRLYVDGQRVRDDGRFALDGRVRRQVHVEPDEIRRLIDAPEPENRVYRCIRITGWEGEFVLSIFLNFARAGRSLFAEARYFLLAPFKGEYLAVDGLDPRPRLGQRLKAVFAALPQTARLLVLALPHLVGELRAAIRRRRARRLARRLSRNPSFDFGATTSIRELAQSQGYRRYFQQLDRDMAGKIVERQILDSIVRFLDERNVDTSELEDRQTAILNNGVIVSGGTLKAESLAVGSKARARVTHVARTAKETVAEGSATK